MNYNRTYEERYNKPKSVEQSINNLSEITQVYITPFGNPDFFCYKAGINKFAIACDNLYFSVTFPEGKWSYSTDYETKVLN
jgi:hypothetical protein